MELSLSLDHLGYSLNEFVIELLPQMGCELFFLLVNERGDPHEQLWEDYLLYNGDIDLLGEP